MKRRNNFDIINKYVIFNSQNIKNDEKNTKNLEGWKNANLELSLRELKMNTESPLIKLSNNSLLISELFW